VPSSAPSVAILSLVMIQAVISTPSVSQAPCLINQSSHTLIDYASPNCPKNKSFSA
jgi:hypothetical protein